MVRFMSVSVSEEVSGVPKDEGQCQTRLKRGWYALSLFQSTIRVGVSCYSLVDS